MSITSIMSILIAIIALSIIILVHETGHFLFAKLFKVAVYEFSLGMGPRLISFIKNNTRYSIKAIPFGGSCAMVGEDPSGSGDFSVFGAKELDDGRVDFNGVVYTKKEIEEHSLQNADAYKKLLICLGGPLFNFILAFLLSIVLISFIGIDKPYVYDVAKDSAASKAHPVSIMKNDLITGVETVNTKEKITVTRDLSLFMFIHNDEFETENTPLFITFERNGVENKSVIFPQYDKNSNKYVIGVNLTGHNVMPNNIIELLQYSYYEVGFSVYSTIQSLKLLFTGGISPKEISGPVGAVAVMGGAISDASSYSILSAFIVLIEMIILISSNLGVMNLIPIPALDGGRIIFALYEMITGKKVNAKVEAALNSITMLLLLLLMFVVFGNDIYRLISGV